MALPALLGAGARAVGGSMVKTGGRAVAAKVLGRREKKQVQPGRIVPGRDVMDGGKGGAIIKPKVKMVSAKEIKSLQTGDAVSPGKDPLKSIYSNVILIEKILKGTNIADRDALKEQKKNDKKADKSDQEKKLETKPPKIDKKKGEVMKLPQTGVFGWIKNFIGNILMGYFAVRLIKYLPQIMGLLKGLGHVVDFVTDVGMFLVDGMATFIDFAYNVYDGTRNIMKGIGLEGAFDAVMKAVEVAITVLTFALGAKSLGGFGDSRGGKGKPGRGKPQTRIAGPKGNLLGSQDRVTSTAAARRYANRFGRDAAEKRFGKDAVSGLGGRFGRSRATNFARGAATGVAKKLGGRQGVKMLASLGKIGKFLKVPVIGSIISVVISLMNGDPIQKALFKGVGTAVGGALGGFLSTFIGVPPLGLFLGGIIGDYVGDLLYTLFFGGGLKEAGAKLGNDLKGLFMGIGDGVKAIFSWVFGGGLLDLLKNVGGGLLKFAGYILNPGGLLWDMLKAGGAVVGAITNFLFGGGLLDLIKNVGGGVLKFIGYILMPNGLLFDALKAGGAAAKMIFDFAKSIVGNLVGGAVEGTKRVAGGFFDALTFNLFDFDKQNKVETKKSGGEVGRDFQESTLKQQRKSIRKKPTFQKIKAPEGGKVKTGKKTERAYWDFLGWAGTGGEEETMQLGAGGMMLANRIVNVANAFQDDPYFGSILTAAAKFILGQEVSGTDFKNVGRGINMLVGDGIEQGKIAAGIRGYEDGGLIENSMRGVDISRWVSDTFKKEMGHIMMRSYDMSASSGSGEDEELASNSPMRGTGLTANQISGAALNMTQKQAFATVYELAKKHKAKFPEIVAAQAMHETGYMDPNLKSVFNSTGRTNAFGQTGDRGYGVLPRAGDSSGWTKYPTLDKAVEDNIKLWHRVDNHPGNYEAFDTPIKGILSVVGAYSPNTDPANIAKGYTETSYVGAMQKIMKSMGFDPYKANELTDLSSDAQLQAVSPLGASPGSSTPEGMIQQMEAQENAGMSAGNGNRMYLHWSAGGYNSIVGPYHTVFTGDGTMHRQYDYNKVTGHTESRNSGSISLSVMAMAGAAGSYQWPTKAQIEGLVNEAARIAKEWGWSPSDVTIPNVMTHGEAGSNVDGATPHTNYGPYGRGANAVSSIDAMASGRIDDFERWDLDMLSPSDQYGEGGNKIRSMIAQRLGEMSNGEDNTKRSHAGTKLSNREQMLKILPGQSLLDENTSKAIGATNLARFNAASTPQAIQNIAGQIAGVSDYAPYEQGAQQTVVVQDPPQQMPEESPQSSGGGMMAMSGGSSHDPFEFLDFQG